ncbi:MAG: DUF1015 family protein [Nocardioides sp.]|jgi:uncharacterized protein (DUF1015 family)
MESMATQTPPYLASPLTLLPFVGLTISPTKVGEHAAARATARPYRDVAARLLRWQAQGRILRDRSPAVYVHEYSGDGLTVRGLVGLIPLSRRARSHNERAVFPHEGVYQTQSEQLASRMAEMRINPAPILLVHQGRARLRGWMDEITKESPLHQFQDRAGQQHRVWAIRGESDLQALQRIIAKTQAIIADGHHRYTAYLRLQAEHPGTGWDFGLAMLVDQADTPLFLGAIHRVLHGVDLATLGDAVAGTPHRLEIRSRERALEVLSPDCVVVSDSRSWAILRLALLPGQIAVGVLHDELLSALAPAPTSVDYHHSVESALQGARRGRAVAVILPAPTFDQVRDAVTHDRLLPQKATSFQPKPSVGVLMRSLDE